jgi:hypothetical protein
MKQFTTPRLALLVAFAALSLLFIDRFTTRVEADGETKAPALGPASSLILESELGETITLKVDDKRLAWGDQPTKRVNSVAYVHIGKGLAGLLQGESFIEENQALQEELIAAMQSITEAFETVQAKMQGITPDDPEFEAINQEGQAVLQQRERFTQQANTAKAMLGAEQLERAYRELVDAVNVVADRLEIDTVHRFIPTDDSFEIKPSPGAFQAAMLQIRLRSVLRYPEDIDITSEVMEELGIE